MLDVKAKAAVTSFFKYARDKSDQTYNLSIGDIDISDELLRELVKDRPSNVVLGQDVLDRLR